MKRIKTLILLIIASSLIVYLEWGKNQSTFLFETEFEIIKQLFIKPYAIIHPFTMIPILGQIVLLVNLFSSRIRKKIILLGIGCIGMLVVFIFLIGLMSVNIKIITYSLPFLAISTYTILYLKQSKTTNKFEIPN